MLRTLHPSGSQGLTGVVDVEPARSQVAIDDLLRIRPVGRRRVLTLPAAPLSTCLSVALANSISYHQTLAVCESLTKCLVPTLLRWRRHLVAVTLEEGISGTFLPCL